MMICKADFEELFPEIFGSEPRLSPKPKVHQPSVECLGRWEDDGGDLGAAPKRFERARQHTLQVANHWPASMRIAPHWALAPRLMAGWPALGPVHPDWRPPFQ
ncbi:hypothetical protein SAMN05216227_10382 [Pseudorhodobacter antarcticus]|uniref:Uncharacterized protein n=1 Tax=Pseudorhodobacter antarcticus TaxID=1077947 RepID=A0A1H8L313_9RHOB|nr:hypothetical protein SAMN05216227_10382 [Pseudorhodobacter antarcticus]